MGQDRSMVAGQLARFHVSGRASYNTAARAQLPPVARFSPALKEEGETERSSAVCARGINRIGEGVAALYSKST